MIKISAGWLGQREKWFLMLIDNDCQPIFESRVKTGKRIICKTYHRTIRGAGVGTSIFQMGKLRFSDVSSLSWVPDSTCLFTTQEHSQAAPKLFPRGLGSGWLSASNPLTPSAPNLLIYGSALIPILITVTLIRLIQASYVANHTMQMKSSSR